MIYTTLSGRLRWSWTKNAQDVHGLVLRRYPDFVLRDVEALGDVIPVFTFHTALPDAFEYGCRSLVEGGYRTLGADEFLEILEGKRRPPPRSVLLTFDDGLGSLWAVAFPLLRRYGLRAIAFVVSGLATDDAALRPTLDDVSTAGTLLPEIATREQSDVPLCTWRELRSMQDSGVIDVQSHSHFHALVHCGPRIRDFSSPSMDPSPLGRVNLPVVREAGEDRYDRPLVLGRPLYEAVPRMAGRCRYFDDEELRGHCEAYVAERGGRAFFERRSWRRELHGAAERFRRDRGERGQLESPEQCEQAILDDVIASRELIEERIGNRVHHFCLPWYRGSTRAVAALRAAGYRAAYWGLLPDSGSTRAGADPFSLPRLDGRYLARLPGPLRRPLSRVLREHFLPGAG